MTGFLNFRVLYRAIDDGIEVARVLHGARDVPRALSEDEAV